MKADVCRRAGLVLTTVVAFLALAGQWTRAAEGALAPFDAANKLYEQGKYSEAAAAYEALVTRKQASAAVYFNLGNAHFKLGHEGRAIAAYRVALRLDPRDPDIRANLRFARESRAGGAQKEGWADRWINVCTPDEVTLMTAGIGWIFLLLLALGHIRRQWAPILRPYRTWLGLALGLMAVWLGLVAERRVGRTEAVVIGQRAVARYGPFEEAQSPFSFEDGAELRVLNQKDAWVYVRDGLKRAGWVRGEDLLYLPRG